jgi:tetratricopeptide (TPR) repeat protein
MIPYPLLFTLLTVGTPDIAPARELNVRAAAVRPKFDWKFGININGNGEFRIGNETEAEARLAHRPLKIRSSASSGTSSDIEVLATLAQADAFENTIIAAAFTDAAICACWTRLKREPKDAAAMVRLGQVLDNVKRFDDAGRWLRRATQISPHDWATWHAFAVHHKALLVRALTAIEILPEHSGHSTEVCKMVGTALKNNAEAKMHAQQATYCYDWAVANAPNAVEPYVARFHWNLIISAFSVFNTNGEAQANEASRSYAATFAADARKIAELSGHPLGYAFYLWLETIAATKDGQVTPDREFLKSLEKVTDKLQAMRRDADPLTRTDAIRALIVAKCLAKDFAGAKRLLHELPVKPGDSTMLSLVALLLPGEENIRGIADLLEDQLPQRNSPADHFVLGISREEAGDVTRAMKVAQNALRKFPNDTRLNLQRTSLLLRYGNAADLSEVHFRLSVLEADFERRLNGLDKPGQDLKEWTDDDREFLQLVRIHRAVYLAIIGRTVVAGELAKHAEDISDEAAEAAAKLAQELNYEPSS